MAQKKIIVGNWKMHGTIPETLKKITVMNRKMQDMPEVDVVLAPPFTALYSASVALQDLPFKLGAQDVHWEVEGAYTGEVAASFLKDAGCDFVIVGHSERRTLFNEDDEIVNKKVHAALAADLVAIMCVGETEEERNTGKTFERLEEQLSIGLAELHVHDLEAFCIAYEPVWAIGTGKVAEVGQVGEVHDWIRNYMAKQFDAPTANNTRLLYGGSVNPENTATLMKAKNVDGLLVGGASLDPEKFMAIIKTAAA